MAISAYVVFVSAVYLIVDTTTCLSLAFVPYIGLIVWAVDYVLLVALMQRAGFFKNGKGGGVGTYFVAGLAYGVFVGIGFLLLVLPGLYLMLRWLPFFPDALHTGEIGEAFKHSWANTLDHQYTLALAVLGPLVLIGTGDLLLLAAPHLDLTNSLMAWSILDVAFALGSAWLTVLQIAVFGLFTYSTSGAASDLHPTPA